MNESFEILKNLIFFTLFASMINFWIEFIFFQQSSKPDPISSKLQVENFALSDGLLQTKVSDDKSISFLQLRWNFPYSTGHIFFALSFLFLSFDLIFRWFLSRHFPLSNLYESLVFLNWSLLAFFFFWQLPDQFLNQNSARNLGASLEDTNLGKPEPKMNRQESEKNKKEDGDLSDSDPKNFQQSWIFFPLKKFYIEKFTNFQLFFGAILSSVILFLQSFADWQLPDDMRVLKPLIPALQSNWLLMHVSIMILSYAALFIGCLLAIVYLFLDFFRESTLLNLGRPQKVDFAVGSADGSEKIENSFIKAEFKESRRLFEELDQKSSQILSFAFPLLTLGILSGAIWANEAWGSYWSWDPKETWAFITWLVFAFYIHTRLQKGWRGKYSASVASFGFFVVWVCYLGVNLLGKGLHSYGWIS